MPNKYELKMLILSFCNSVSLMILIIFITLFGARYLMANTYRLIGTYILYIKEVGQVLLVLVHNMFDNIFLFMEYYCIHNVYQYC